MRTERSKKLIEEIAKKYNLTNKQIENIVNTYFLFLYKMLKEECDKKNDIFPSLRIPYFGIFHVPNKVREFLKKKYSNEII